MVVDALSQKLPEILENLMIMEWKLLEEFQDQNLQIVQQSLRHMVASLVVQPTLLQRIGEAQQKDSRLMKLMEDEEKRTKVGLRVANDGLIKLGEWICVPRDMEVRVELLREAHQSNFTIHPGSTKMYQNLRNILVA